MPMRCQSYDGEVYSACMASMLSRKSDSPTEREGEAPEDEKYTEEEDEEELRKIDRISKSRQRNARGAVSAEVYRDEDLMIPPPKSGGGGEKKCDEDCERIKTALEKSFLFNTLENDSVKEALVDVFEEVKIPKGMELLRQGDPGDALYLVESGSFDVYKKNNSDQTDEKSSGSVSDRGVLVNHMGPGSTVGELALLYSAPRAATVIAAEDSLVWKINRHSFHYYTHAAVMEKRDRIITSLSKVKLFDGLDDSQRQRLADSFRSSTYGPDECVIKEGDEQDATFFILATGEAQAEKFGKAVHKYMPGDYFGELSFLRNQPRAASVRITKGPAVCLTLDEPSCRRLLGSLEELMEKNTKYYSDVPLDERL